MPSPRDTPAARSPDELRNLTVDQYKMLAGCKHFDQAWGFDDVCSFFCAPEDRACEVFRKMHGVVRDDVGFRKFRK